jgi:amino-acid N-acetyltransferase
MTPCVVLDCPGEETRSVLEWRAAVVQQAERLERTVQMNLGVRTRILDNLYSLDEATISSGEGEGDGGGDGGTQTVVVNRKLLLAPLRRGQQIPIILPLAYSEQTQTMIQISADQAILALTKELRGLNLRSTAGQKGAEEDEDEDEDLARTVRRVKALQEQVSVDRLIILDPDGGIPRLTSEAGLRSSHVFLNLEQEYDEVKADLTKHGEKTHLANLDLVRDFLAYVPPSSSAMVTTALEAAKSSKTLDRHTPISGVGTRIQKNPLIHNLLTDKPIYSASLPQSRLNQPSSTPTWSTASTSIPTFAKRGMPITIIPDPRLQPWTPPSQGSLNDASTPRLTLTDPRIDLPALIHLITDSFSRPLNTAHYLSRINSRLAGLVIAGQYEGAALFTWESPSPGTEEGDRQDEDMLPYLDKFAILKRSQGAAGVADIIFNAMVNDCFPRPDSPTSFPSSSSSPSPTALPTYPAGFCWRSRADNPVNKWYFERARGTWRLPGTGWVMFWTGDEGGRFGDYERVCRGVEASWMD